MKTHTFRVEKDYSVTWRAPAGRAVGWGSPSGLAERLRHSNEWISKKPCRLDLSRVPQRLADAQAHLKSALELQDELNKLSPEEWSKFVMHPPTAHTQLEQLKLRESPPR